MSSARLYPRAIARQPKLKVAIADSGLNRLELANKSGLSITYVQHIRGGLSVPLRAAEAVAGALGQDVRMLFEVIEAPKGAQ